jgi:hypothetical protein
MIGLNTKIYLEKIEGQDYREVEVKGKIIRVPNKFKGMEIQSQRARVKYPTLDSILNVGDIVYCHHFLNDEGSKKKMNGEIVYELDINEIYCRVVDGKIEMLGDWLLVEPIEKKGIIVNKKEINSGHLRYGYEKYKDAKVAFEKMSDYELEVEGKVYYRIRKSELLGVYY